MNENELFTRIKAARTHATLFISGDMKTYMHDEEDHVVTIPLEAYPEVTLPAAIGELKKLKELEILNVPLRCLRRNWEV